MSSTTGSIFRLTSYGESHGPAVGAVVDGCPPRLALDVAAIQRDLDRRRPGQSRLTTQRKEADTVEILSGVHEGRTTGTPIGLIVRNADQNPGAYDHLEDVYRPSHADYTYDAKYGFRDHRGGGRSSARETIARVAGGAIARALLAEAAKIEIVAWVSSVGTIDAPEADLATITADLVDAGPTRCPDPATAAAIEDAIDAARRAGDSLGGVVTCVARNVPPGLGAPAFDRLEAALAAAVMSLPATKGFEIGSGFAGTRLRGSEHNDPYVMVAGQVRTTANRSGGVQGGISNGEPIVLRAAFKPTATIASSQQTITRAGTPVELAARGRHDPCVLPRAVPLVEAAVALVLADHWLLQRTVDVLPRHPGDL
ncbi:MAG: chorismate synthase [Actinobacteria bacterium]|nr:chorismate synthase [Actinomycetota bacterium]